MSQMTFTASDMLEFAERLRADCDDPEHECRYNDAINALEFAARLVERTTWLIPDTRTPEYHCLLVWRSNEYNGVHVHLAHCAPGKEPQPLQSSYHGAADVQHALEAALTNFFEKPEEPR